MDLSPQNDALSRELTEAVQRVVSSGQFILGPEVEAFEQGFADFCGTAHAVATNSGTSALHLGLLALGVRPGDEVITVAHTFIATVEAILYCGATPVFVDIDPGTLVMDVGLVEAALTERTRAILPVHLYGNPVEMQALTQLAESRGVPVLEDACQAHGAVHRGKPAGSWGAAGTFSFYPTKNLGGMGEGGILTTDDAGVAETARSLRNHGQSGIYQHSAVGFNYRMSAFQGAVLGVKMGHLDRWNEERRTLAARYREALEGTSIQIVEETPASESAFHLFVVRVPERDRVREALRQVGVHTNIHYPTPAHHQPALAYTGSDVSLPVTERASEEVLSLPLYPGMAETDVDYVAEQLTEAVG